MFKLVFLSILMTGTDGTAPQAVNFPAPTMEVCASLVKQLEASMLPDAKIEVKCQEISAPIPEEAKPVLETRIAGLLKN